MNQSVYRIVATTLSFILVLCSVSIASGSGFQIPDYIPTHFSDLEWRLFGDFNWSADGNNYDNSGNGERDYRQQSMRFGTDMLYRYYTPDNFYNLGSDLSLSLRRTRSNNESISPPAPRYYAISEDSYIRKNINIDWRPEIEAGSYFASDYFASGKASVIFNYDHLFPSQSESYVFRRYIYSNREETEIRSFDSESQDTDIRTIGSFEVNVGRGRVYEGKYASTAMYMVEELRNQGLLVRALSNEEMLALTESVFQLRQKHQVDRRVFKIEALNEILNFLIEAGAMDQESVLSYLTIQDVWDYFPHKKSRKFGYTAMLGFGFVEDYQYRKTYRKQKRETQVTIDYHDSSLTDYEALSSIRNELKAGYSRKSHNEYIFGELAFFKPLSRRLQLNCETRWNFFLNNGGAYVPIKWSRSAMRPNRGLMYIGYEKLHDYVNGAARVEFNYIYNSRTDLDLTALILYETFVYNNSRAELSKSRESLSFDLSTLLTYRISIPTELKIRISYSSSEINSGLNYDSDSSQQRFSLSGSINHYLF